MADTGTRQLHKERVLRTALAYKALVSTGTLDSEDFILLAGLIVAAESFASGIPTEFMLEGVRLSATAIDNTILSDLRQERSNEGTEHR